MLYEEYRKDVNRNYLVLKNEKESVFDEDTLQMVLQNEIQGMLKLEIRSIDNQNQFYYDITGMQKLSELCLSRKLRKKELCALLEGIISVMEEASVYFLDMDAFLLNPDYLYLKTGLFTRRDHTREDGTEGLQWLKKQMVRLCYYPEEAEEMAVQLNHFLEYLMNQIDYKDENAVVLLYQLHQMGTEGQLNFSIVKEVLLEEGEKSFLTKSEWKEEKEKETGNKIENNIGEKTEKKKNFYWERDVSAKKEEKDKYILAVGMCLGFLILCGIYMGGFLNNPLTGKVDFLKVGIVLFVFLVTEGIAGYRFFQVTHKYSKEKIFIEKETAAEEAGKEQKIIADEIRTVNEVRDVNHVRTMNGTGITDRRGMINGLKTIYETGTIDRNRMENERNSIDQTEILTELNEKTQLLAELQEKTMLLKPEAEKKKYRLLSVKKEEGEIIVEEFPFFFGKVSLKNLQGIDNRAVSRFHAKIEEKEGRLYLTDLNSTNGTFLNHVKITANQPNKLNLEDEIMFADSVYRFTLAQ